LKQNSSENAGYAYVVMYLVSTLHVSFIRSSLMDIETVAYLPKLSYK